MELQEQAQSLPIDIAMRKYPDFAAIPAITENDAQRILSDLQQITNIVDLVLQAMMIAGVSGCKIGVTDPLAIEREFIEAMGSDIHPRGVDLLAQSKGCAHIRTGVAGGGIFLPIGFDPGSLPVSGPKQSHFPPARFAPGRGAIALIP